VRTSFKRLAHGVGSLAGVDRSRPGGFISGGRGRHPFEVLSLAVEAVAVLEPDDIASRLGADKRFQDKLSHETSLNESSFVAKRDDPVTMDVDHGGDLNPVVPLDSFLALAIVDRLPLYGHGPLLLKFKHSITSIIPRAAAQWKNGRSRVVTQLRRG
jgi:hypothetical protein